MSKKVAIIIAPNWRDYARKYLADCIRSLRKQDYQGEIKFFLTDNETSEASFVYIKKIAPEVEIIRNKDNDGFAKGNNDAIKIALAKKFDYIILFNMDTVVEASCVSEMVKAVEREGNPPNPLYQGGVNPPNPLYQGGVNPPDPPASSTGQALYQGGEPPLTPLYKGGEIGAVQARLMLYDDKQKINSLGNITHFLGFGYCLGYNEEYNPLSSQNPPYPLYQGGRKGGEICYPSGAAVLFRAETLRKVGLFDEEFWMYNEDQDLGWRIWLAGFKCVLAPKAVVYHKYEFAKSVKQYYWMDRNRMIVMIKNYHVLTLLLILPACLIMEFGLLLFSLKTGWFKEKLKVYKYFLTPKKWVYLVKARRQAQSLRKVKDRDIVKMFTGKIWYQEVGDWKLRVINPVFQVYWWVVRKIIFW